MVEVLLGVVHHVDGLVLVVCPSGILHYIGIVVWGMCMGVAKVVLYFPKFYFEFWHLLN
jgi:hypothetical protein